MDRLFFSTIVLAILGAGLMGGFFFAFSNLVMPALGRVSAPNGIAAMQAINVVVQNPVFFLFFFGTPLLCVLLAVLALMNVSQPASLLVLAAAVIYVLGVFVVTVVMNVPMNETLAPLDPAAAASADYWHHYIDRWTLWNHVRTVGGLAACVLFAASLRAAA